MGNRNGRICLINQIDFDEDTLEYSSSVGKNSVGDFIKSDNGFTNAISQLLHLHATERVESAFKQIKYKNLFGVCLKSFPRSELTSRLLNLLMLCMGGFNGTELVHLPFEGTILDQPNIFIEAYNIYTSEYNSFVQEQRKIEKKDAK
jgi:hypothetical protein